MIRLTIVLLYVCGELSSSSKLVNSRLSFRSTSLIRKFVTLSVASMGFLGPYVPHSFRSNNDFISRADDSNSGSGERSVIVKGKMKADGEVASLFRKAIQCESDLDFEAAQNFYEQVVVVEPNYILGWSNLGNVLTSRGNLEQALLCYRKAISLYPPTDVLATIVLNKASIELSTGRTEEALRDLTAAERLAGPKQEILTTKAVALTNIGQWNEAAEIFEKVISTAEKNALPWWLRYSMSLLETGRGIEAVAFYQRILNRFPDEPEGLAFGSALYTSLGAPTEGRSYWKKLSLDDRNMYSAPGFISDKLLWGPKAVKSFNTFMSSKYSIVE